MLTRTEDGIVNVVECVSFRVVIVWHLITTYIPIHTVQ